MRIYCRSAIRVEPAETETIGIQFGVFQLPGFPGLTVEAVRRVYQELLQ